ncbi:MAG TPA: hypothetical protein VGF19_11530 [Candidatus Acidoferrum sp.]
MENQNNLPTVGVPSSAQIPAPTVWPFVFAVGLALVFAGLLTSVVVSVVGVVLSIPAAVGWFRDVLPRECLETVPVEPGVPPIVARQAEVARIQIDPEIKRTRIPVEVYPVTAGVKGGLAGGIAMAVLAVLFGVLTYHSVWYPINLLASIVYAQALNMPVQHLLTFHPALLLVATLIHLVASLLVGLLYGVLLPMFPRRPILLGGFIAPLIWTGLLYTSLGVINPLMNKLIDWKWFVISQIGFGLVAGFVVVRQARIRTVQFLPFALRAGIEAPGLMREKNGGHGEK